MTNQEQTALIARIVAGETELFEQLVRKHQTRVYNLALRMVSEPADAEDCAQEAFIKAFRALPGFRGESSFSSWLYRLTSNVCLDFLRARRRRASATDASARSPERARQSRERRSGRRPPQKTGRSSVLSASEKGRASQNCLRLRKKAAPPICGLRPSG